MTLHLFTHGRIRCCTLLLVFGLLTACSKQVDSASSQAAPPAGQAQVGPTINAAALLDNAVWDALRRAYPEDDLTPDRVMAMASDMLGIYEQLGEAVVESDLSGLSSTAVTVRPAVVDGKPYTHVRYAETGLTIVLPKPLQSGSAVYVLAGNSQSLSRLTEQDTQAIRQARAVISQFAGDWFAAELKERGEL